MNQPQEQVSFLGLGPLGMPLALHLLHGWPGHLDCRVFDPLAESLEPLLALGAVAADRLGTLVRPGSVVLTMIPDDRLFLQMTLGDEGILKQLGAGGVHVSLAPVSPPLARQLDKLSRMQGSAFVAATVLGSPELARQRAVTLCLAGELRARQRVHPLLTTMSEQIVDVGTPVERATLVHTAATTFHAVLLEALGEMVALGEAWGMKRGPMRRWLLASPWLQELLHDPERARIATPAAPGRFSVLDALAAVELAIQMGQEHDLDLPCADVVYERLLLALEEGRGELDCSALSRFARPEARSDGFSTPGDAP